MNTATHFPAAVKSARKSAKLSQRQLATALGVSVMTVRRYEWGEHLPTVQKLVELATVLGSSPSKLLGFQENTSGVSSSATEPS